MNEGEGHQNEGIVSRFARRNVAKHEKREAQLDLGGDKGMDDLFKPEKPEMNGPDLGKPGDDLGEGGDHEMGDEMHEEKRPVDEIKESIEAGDLSVDDLDELGDFIAEKRVDLTEDTIDTEMDRDEAEAKDDMKKNEEPIGNEANATMGYGAPATGGSAPKATGTPVQ